MPELSINDKHGVGPDDPMNHDWTHWTPTDRFEHRHCRVCGLVEERERTAPQNTGIIIGDYNQNPPGLPGDEALKLQSQVKELSHKCATLEREVYNLAESHDALIQKIEEKEDQVSNLIATVKMLASRLSS